MADENITDLEYIQRRFDALQRELREGLQTIAAFEARLDEKLAALEARLLDRLDPARGQG